MLRTGTTAELVGEVLHRKLEGAFGCGPVRLPELGERGVFEEELVLLSAPSERRRLDSLLRKPDLRIIALRAGCCYRQRLERIR